MTAASDDCPAGDTTPPSDPGDLQVALTASSATLTWQDSTDDTAVVGYDVYSGGAKVATEASASHVFVVGCGHTYTYGVVAFDLARNRSHMSTVSVSTPDCPGGDGAAPSKPTGLDVTLSGSSAWLSWSASTDNVGVTGYDVYAGTTKIATEVVTSHVFTVSCGHTYTFGVIAFDAAGNRSSMATISVATDSCPTGDVFDVSSYGAKGDGSSNDTAAFAKAISAASSAGSTARPGVVYVPKATYVLANVILRSNVTVNVEAGTTMKLAAGATGNSAIFYLGNYTSGEASWIDNVTVTGVNGSYTMDVARSTAPRGHGFTVKNVRHFEISNVQGMLSNSATSGLPPEQPGRVHHVPLDVGVPDRRDALPPGGRADQERLGHQRAVRLRCHAGDGGRGSRLREHLEHRRDRAAHGDRRQLRRAGRRRGARHHLPQRPRRASASRRTTRTTARCTSTT